MFRWPHLFDHQPSCFHSNEGMYTGIIVYMVFTTIHIVCILFTSQFSKCFSNGTSAGHQMIPGHLSNLAAVHITAIN